MIILKSVIQLPPLLFSACILMNVHTWSNDDISTYTVTQKPDGSSSTLVVRTHTDDDHHLLITELRPGAEEPEQEAGAQATGDTSPETAERRVISIHPHRWAVSDAAGTHFHYRTDFPTADHLRAPNDIHFIFDQWLSSPYFGSESHGELVTMSHIGREHQNGDLDDLTRLPNFRFGIMPSLNVLDRLTSLPTTPETELELLLPIPPIAIPVSSRAGSGTMEVAPSISRPVVVETDDKVFTVQGYTEWEYNASSEIQGCGLSNKCSAFLYGLARRFSGAGEDIPVEDIPDQLPVTASFTYHPENDRVQLDRLEIGEYLTITHTSSGETDSQDEFVRRLLNRWEEYLKQEQRFNFKGEKYWDLYLKRKKEIDRMYDTIIQEEQENPSGYLKRHDPKKLFGEGARDRDAKEEAAEDLLRPHRGKYLRYRWYQDAQDNPRRLYLLEYPNSFLHREREWFLLREGSEPQSDLPASHGSGTASTSNSTPSASDSSPLAGEPLSRSTLLLPDINIVPKAE